MDPKKYYCGAFWCPMWVKKLLSKKFNEACYLHDRDYDRQAMTRKQIDKLFLQRMLETSDSVFWAVTFYMFVRLLGWISWK